MAEKFELEITTPGELVFNGNVEMAIIPGEEGELGVLAGHAPVITTIETGLVNIYEGDEVRKRVFVSNGFSEVNQNECSVLVTTAEDLDEITKQDVEGRIEKAEVKRNVAENGFDRKRAEEDIEINKQILNYL